MEKTIGRTIWDFLGFPLRAFILDEKTQMKMGFTTLKEERFSAVLSLMKGKVLDIGCGPNELMKIYRARGGDGTGIDVHPFGGADYVIDINKQYKLPFKDGEFDTVTMIAVLHHIPKDQRAAVLSECRRVLNKGGKLLLTQLGLFLGWLGHKLQWWDRDQMERDVDWEKEDYGVPAGRIIGAGENAGVRFIRREGFIYGLNKLYIFQK